MNEYKTKQSMLLHFCRQRVAEVAFIIIIIFLHLAVTISRSTSTRCDDLQENGYPKV